MHYPSGLLNSTKRALDAMLEASSPVSDMYTDLFQQRTVLIEAYAHATCLTQTVDPGLIPEQQSVWLKRHLAPNFSHAMTQQERAELCDLADRSHKMSYGLGSDLWLKNVLCDAVRTFEIMSPIAQRLGPQNPKEAADIMHWLSDLRDASKALAAASSALELTHPAQTCASDAPAIGCCDIHDTQTAVEYAQQEVIRQWEMCPCDLSHPPDTHPGVAVADFGTAQYPTLINPYISFCDIPPMSQDPSIMPEKLPDAPTLLSVAHSNEHTTAQKAAVISKISPQAVPLFWISMGLKDRQTYARRYGLSPTWPTDTR